MTHRTMAERRRSAAERDTRRASLLVLLDRAQRGVPLDYAEAALLRAHVTSELSEADELRRTVAGQQTAIQRAHARTHATEAAIIEAQQEAARLYAAWCSARRRASEHARNLRALAYEYRAVAARADQAEEAHARSRAAGEYQFARAKQAEQLLAAYKP